MRKSIINISAIASIMAVAIAITSILNPSSASAGVSDGSDFDPLLYIEGMAGKGMLKEYSKGRKLTRVKAAELYGRLYARTMGEDYSLPRLEDTLKDTNDMYAVAATGLGLMKAKQGRFIGKSAVTVDGFIGAMSRVMAASPDSLAKLKAAGGGRKAKVADISKMSAGGREMARLLVSSGALKTDSKGRLGVSGAITEARALGAVRRLSLIVEESSLKTSYGTIRALGYELPKSEETDILFGITATGKLNALFSGIMDPEKGLGADDVHYQAIQAVRSGSAYGKADLAELLEYISTHWDATSKRYAFKRDAWIKNGKVVYAKPSGDHIFVRSGVALDITLSRRGNKK